MKCDRCRAAVHGRAQDQPHLCKDLAKRLERQTKAVQIVRSILIDRAGDIAGDLTEDAALEIVKALSGRDLGVD